MKIIDLLNKIANGEELPEIIKVMGATYYLCGNDQSGCCYFSEKQGFGGVKLSFDTSVMNDEIEIIEDTSKEEKKIPEEFKVHSLGDKDENGNFVNSPFPTDEEFMNKINDIIHYLQYLKSKGE